MRLTSEDKAIIRRMPVMARHDAYHDSLVARTLAGRFTKQNVRQSVQDRINRRQSIGGQALMNKLAVY